jgi:hypothetical protein
MKKLKEISKKLKSNYSETQKDLLLSQNSKRRTWLHIAAQSGSSKIIAHVLGNQLFREITEIDRADKYGYTPAILACISHKEKEISNLHLLPTDSNEIPDSYRTEILKSLTKADSDWDRKNYEGNYNPMHWAIFNKDVSLASHILVQNPNMSTAMFRAVIQATGEQGIYPFELPFILIKRLEERKKAMAVSEFALKTILEIMKIAPVLLSHPVAWLGTAA